ncbi:acyl-CoA carboxylase epsilon subunit [Agromyces humi]|uniref:acyl-CoA carboxylase epsilon subunit n=1 Tax=Agromyces humi TaxID=1766800 RepID=UPI00135A911E|nr:acyl-CoA carboxylase epsilon subunit [Agromyces humi]
MTDDTTPGNPGTSRPSGDAVADDRVDAIRFVTRRVSDEETAAVTAVLLAALDEAAGTAAIADEPRRDPWVRSGNALRTSIEVGRGAWSRSTR